MKGLTFTGVVPQIFMKSSQNLQISMAQHKVRPVFWVVQLQSHHIWHVICPHPAAATAVTNKHTLCSQSTDERRWKDSHVAHGNLHFLGGQFPAFQDAQHLHTHAGRGYWHSNAGVLQLPIHTFAHTVLTSAVSAHEFVLNQNKRLLQAMAWHPPCPR